MENAIEIVHVTKKFKETVAVNGVTVSLERGKIHGIIGRNGSGKTVLFKCICGLFPVTEGEITVLGACLREWEPSSKPQVFCPIAPATKTFGISWS